MHDVRLMTITCAVWSIWDYCNKSKFQNQKPNFLRASMAIEASTRLVWDLTSSSMPPSIYEFSKLKAFNVCCHPRKLQVIKQVRWHPPLAEYIKCNTNEATKGSLGVASCPGIFRNHHTSIVGCFTSFLGIKHALFGEISTAITTIKIVHEKGWRNLWLECDLLMVVQAFKKVNLVPWSLRNRWRNAVIRTRDMNFIVGHIYREGNTCVDKLVSYRTDIQDFCWWDFVPTFIFEIFLKGQTRFSLLQF